MTREQKLEIITAAVELLRDGMNQRDEVKADKDKHTARLRELLNAISAPFKVRSDDADALIAEAKQTLIDLEAEHEAERTAAIESGAPVPAPLEYPAGVQWSRKPVFTVTNLDALPDDCLKVVADTDKIEERIASGEKVEGIEVSTNYSVQLRR